MNDRSRKPDPALAGSEGDRDRCQRTGTGPVLRIAKQTRFLANVLLNIPLVFSVTSPYARVCTGFASDYSWSGSIEKTPRPLK